MKNIFKPLLILLVAVSFASCSTDDDSSDNNTNDTSSTSAELIGTWEMASLDYEGTSSTETQGQTFSVDFVGVAQNIDYTLEITEDEFIGNGAYDIELTTTSFGQNTTMVLPFDDVSGTATYTREGNTIISDGGFVSIGTGTTMMSMGGETTIAELTDTTLRLTQDVTQNIESNGIISTVTVSSVIVLNRL